MDWSGLGGTGGGGNATETSIRAGDGSPNTGGGGGGTGYDAQKTIQLGGNGGSGIVVIRYVLESDTPVILNHSVTNLTTTGATFRGYLSSTGTSETTVSVYWGEGPDNWANTNTWSAGHWAEGSYAAYTNTTLASNKTYYYTFGATNDTGGMTASPPMHFITGEVSVEATADEAEWPDTGVFTISRPAGATNEALTVYFELSGTATQDVHYTLSPSGSVTIPAGETSATVTLFPELSGSGEATLTVADQYNYPVSGASDAATVTISAAPASILVWTGASGTAWTNAANWETSGASRYPQADTDDVIIDGGTGNPVLTVPVGGLTIRSLKIGETVAKTLTFSNGNVTDRKLIVTSNVVIGANGTLTHTANSTTAAGEVHRLFLDVGGDLTVEVSGRIHADGRGHSAQNGLGGGSGNYVAAVHGGQASGNSKNTYGSIRAPVHLGSGGNSGSPGGGAIKLDVAGAILVNGTITATGAQPDGTQAHKTSGTGGSIFITAGTMSGSGSISANGGYCSSKYQLSSSGGRIALILGIGGIENVTAYSGDVSSAPANRGAAGTIYVQVDTEHGRLIVDNSTATTTRLTEISPGTTDAVVGDVLLRNAGRLGIAGGETLAVHGNWSNTTANAVMGAGAVEFVGPNTATFYGSTTFVNLLCTTAGKTLKFEAGKTQTVTSSFTFTGEKDNLLTLESTDPGTKWNLSQSVVHSVQYVAVSNSVATVGSVTAEFSKDNGGNVNWVFSDPEPIVWTGTEDTDWANVANWDPQRLPLADDPSITIAAAANQPVLDITREFNGSLTIASDATLNLGGNNLTINGAVTNAGTLTATGTEILTCRADVDFTGGTFNRAQSTLILDGVAAQTFKPAGNVFYDIQIPNTNLLTVTDGFIVRNWTFQGSVAQAVFNGNVTATNIVCNSTTATNTFSGGVTADAFHSLNTGGGLLTFGSGTDSNIRVLALRGGSGTPLVLRSSTPGAAWNLNVTDGSSVRFVDVQDSDASGGITVYALDSTGAAANNTNWDFGSGKVWVGTTTLWATGANWSPEGTPGATSYVLIDGFGSAQPTLNLSGGATGVLHLVVGVSSSATLTFSNGDVTDKKLVVTSNVVIGVKGTLTHTANSTTVAGAVHRLFLDVGGSLTVEPGGTIDASYRGYAQNQGPSRGDHGGRGQGGDGVPYGSITAPVSLGSGGRAYSQSRAGGGAVKLNVAGNTVINGTVRVVGQPPGSGYSFGGAGGSVFLTSGTLAGNGTVDASGANGTTGHDATGGGGRIAVILTNGMDIGNVRLMAYGGKASGGGYGVHSAAGTVYVRLQDQSRGKMMVANNNLTSDYQTLVTSNVTAVVVGDVEIRDAAWFQIMADQTLTVYGSWSNAATFSSLSGSTVEFAGPAPVSVWGDTTWDNLTIATSGKTVSFEADKTQTVNGTPTFDNRVKLLSTEPGGQWKLTVPIDGENTTQPVGRVSARDSDASGGRTIIPQGGSDLDNNLNWIFPPPGLFLLLR